MSDREFEHTEAREEAREMADTKREEEDDRLDELAVKGEEEETPVIKDEEDEDEDDDDDEEEDEEEEERVKGRKRARPDRSRNQFLDVEAEVSDDEDDEDEDDDDLAREGFITGDHDHDGEEIAGRDDRLHRQVDRTRDKNAEEDAQKMADAFKERYGRTNKYRGDDSGQVSQRFLLPSINDPSIWAVRCRPGREKDAVKKLLQRKLTLQGKPNSLKILSAFQRDNFTGYIYIEAEKLAAVDVAIRGFADIYPNNKVLVPVEEFPDLLRPSKSSEIKVQPGSYVRIKRGKYKGDLAIVDAVEESGLEMTLQVVPRLDYSPEIDESGKRKRATSKFRPSQRLFSQKEALEHDSINLTARSSNTFTYRGEDYIDGFLFKLYKLQHLETQNVSPSLEEISRFNTGDSDDLDLTSISQSLKQSNLGFNAGDRVQVLQGEQQGLQADVVSASNDIVIIKPRDFKGGNMEFPPNNLRKIFNEGDHVSVLKGKHAGHTGIVVSVNEDHVTFISDQSHKDVTVFANTLTKSDDTSTLVDAKYDLHELVRVNATTVGVIIRADQDVFTVLSQDGRILSLPPSGIVSTVIIPTEQVFSTDANGEGIKKGDSVREESGFKRSGVVLHIFRSFVFVYSKETAENNGVFVCDNTSLVNSASKINSDEKREKLDLTKMNPKFRTGGEMAPPPVPVKFNGRDRCLNQSVSIRLGEYKGYRGIVKDTNGDIARVELHTKNKILSISKQKLAFVDKAGKLVPYEEFINNRFDNANSFSSASSSYAGSSVSGHSSSWSGAVPSVGGRTPGWSNASRGGQTSYGGGTAWGAATGAATNYGAAGAGTAWGGGTAHGGAGTAWGGGTAHGGAGTAWGGGAAPGTAWGGNRTGQASSYGGHTAGWREGAASAAHQGAYVGNQSSYDGNQSSYNGNQSAWGGGTAHNNWGGARPANNWGVPATPGFQSSAPTPGPNDNYDPENYSAPTPGAYPAAPTPGAM